MKSLFLSFVLVFLSSCAVAEEKTGSTSLGTEHKIDLYFNGHFSIELSLSMFSSAKVVADESILIMFEDRSNLSGLVVMNGEGSLPEGYDIHDYPRYLFGLKELDGLPEVEQQSFKGSLSELNYRLNTPEVITYSDPDKVYYHACSSQACESYIVKKAVKDQILMLHGEGFDLEFMKTIAEGI